MNSKEYWEKREAEALKHRITDEKEYEKRIRQIYDNMLNSVQTEINAFYGKYAYKNGITIAEAKKAVKQADIAAYKFKAKQYVKEKDFSKQANEEMALYNLTMKVNRLELLKANIGLELIKGHNELEKFMSKILQGRTMDELKRQAGILGKTIQNNAQLAHAIVNASFHNATFSDRIWQYQDLMKNQLATTLQTGLIQGKNPRAIAGELRRYWYGNDPKTGKGAVYCMERLMRTELARVQTEAQKQSFEKNGFEMYTFHTNTGCCDICAELDGKHFKVKDMMPGTNAAPMHPNCRCSCSAYEDSEEYEQWLDFLVNGGTTEEYNKLKAQPKTEANAYKKYKTLSNYDDNIEWEKENLKDHLERCRGVPKEYQTPYNTFEKETPKYLSQLSTAFEKFDFATNTDGGAIEKILKDGKLKGLLETGTTNGHNDVQLRKSATETLFGLYGEIDELKADQFEKYGYLGKADRAKSLYGDCRIVLKKDNLWDRTTFTVGDSLEGMHEGIGRIPSLVSKPEIVSLGTDIFNEASPSISENILSGIQQKFDSIEKHGYFKGVVNPQDYVELQFHGAVTLDDFEYIEVSANCNNLKEIQKLAAEKNVELRVIK